MPNSLACPAIKALPNGIPFAETFRKITPLGTGFGNPENAINEQAIVFGCHPRIALLAGQKVLDTFPMFIRDSVARQHGGPSLVRENRVRSLPQLPNYCPHGLAFRGILRTLNVNRDGDQSAFGRTLIEVFRLSLRRIRLCTVSRKASGTSLTSL